MRRGWTWIAACLSALLAVAGPARAGLQSDKELAAGEGAMLTVFALDFPSTTNINAVAGTPILSVRKLDGDKPREFFLWPRHVGLHSSRAYAASLPPGRYRLYDLQAQVCKILCSGPHEAVPDGLPEFEVRAGEVADLGVLAMAITRAPGAKESRTELAYQERPDPAVGQRLLAGIYPEFAALKLPLRPGWTTDADTGQVAAMRRMRGHSSGMYFPAPFGNDGFYFAGQLGSIKRWSPDAAVAVIDTGTAFALRTIAVEGDRLLAGGEATTLLASADAGRTWTDVSTGLPYGDVVQVVAIGGGEVALALAHGESVSLFRGRFDGGAWTRLGEWPSEFKFWTGMPGVLPQLMVQGRDLFLTLPSKRALHFPLDGGEPFEIKMPGSFFQVAFDRDRVLRCRCARSIVTNPWESRDLGRTWKAAEGIDRWMMLPVFRDENRGFTYIGALFNQKKSGVMATADGGKTWTRVASGEDLQAGEPFYSADGSVMLLVGTTAMLNWSFENQYASRDGGATWRRLPGQRRWAFPRSDEDSPSP